MFRFAPKIQGRVKSLATAGLLLSVLALSNVVPLTARAATPVTDNVVRGAKVSFTFDDGLASAATLAGPTLQKYGMTGTDYIITNCIGMTTVPNTCAANTDATYMTWAQVSQLNSTYGWEIGSHTLNHPLTAAADNPSLTDAQLDAEMSQSQAALKSQGFNATDFASPYGDYDNRSLAASAKYYNSHRAFQDFSQPPAAEEANTFPYYSPRDTYPYNNNLLTVMQVQGNVPVATVESYINTAKAKNQWLILVFHEIKASGASKLEADYQYNNADLDTIAAYVKAQNVPVTDIAHGLATGNDLMPNSSFNDGVADGWTTDDPTNIKADKQSTSLAGHGSYDGTAQGPLNSIALNGKAGSTTDTHLFSPTVPVTTGTNYTLKNFVNVTSTSGEVDFFVDEYDANGVYLGGSYHQGVTGSTVANTVQVGQVNFTYTPSSATVAKADLQVIVHGANTRAYLDNAQWLSPTLPPPTDTTPPVISAVTAPVLGANLTNVDWNTDEASTSQVEYGLTTAYGTTTTLDNTLKTTHQVNLTGLTGNTTYHYRVISKDAAGNTATSADGTFTTNSVIIITVKVGDVNNDGVVDILDLSTVLGDWNQTGKTTAQGDLNGDGVVDILDLSTVLANWSL